VVGEVLFELGAAADPRAADEDLRGRVHPLLRLERLDVLARAQDVLVDLIPVLLQALPRPHSERASVIGQDHSIERGGAVVGHGVRS
jgi:hypothetical protein